MKQCCLCKENKNKGQNLYYGFVCSDCIKALPNLFSLRKLSEEQVKWFYNHRYKFSETSSLGIMALDEPHALIKINHGFAKKGDNRNVFSLLDMKEVSLSCTNARQNGDHIICDAQLEFTLRCNLQCKRVIKQMLKCPLSDSKQSGYYEVNEPKLLCLFRSMMNQSISNQYSEGKVILEKLNEIENSRDRVLAKGILMLPDIYTDEELKRNRNSLIKALHPDNYSDEMASEFTDKINWAYRILKRD